MNIWSLFNQPIQRAVRPSRHYIVEEDLSKFEVTEDYALNGIEEGWLEYMDMNIDWTECEHIKYRLIG